MSTIEENETEVRIKQWVDDRMTARDKFDIASIALPAIGIGLPLIFSKIPKKNVLPVSKPDSR